MIRILGIRHEDDKLPNRPENGKSSGASWDIACFRALAEPVTESVAFSRLRRITFLGILSPQYKSLPGFPISYSNTVFHKSDRTRAHHSLNVAWLAGCIASKLQLSRSAVNYAVVWGLTHDIAAWPLSHTGEAAFSRTTETDARDLRKMMILGSRQLPKGASLYSAIKGLSIEHDLLLALFDKNAKNFESDLTVIHRLIHSAVTPDTIEGMYRSGKVFEVASPLPNLFVDAFERDLISDVRLKGSHSKLAFSFWRKKSKIYSQYINSPKTIEFESNWSRMIQEYFVGLPLVESLSLPEREIIERIVNSPSRNRYKLLKYKDPMIYKLSDDHKLRRSFCESVPLDKLSEVFVRGNLL